MKLRVFFLLLLSIVSLQAYSNQYDSLFQMYMSTPSSFKTTYFSFPNVISSYKTHTGLNIVSRIINSEHGELELKELIDNHKPIAYSLSLKVKSNQKNKLILKELSSSILNNAICFNNNFKETYTYEFINIIDTNVTLFNKNFKTNIEMYKFSPYFLYTLSPFSGEEIGSFGGYASQHKKTSDIFFNIRDYIKTEELLLLFNSSNYYIKVLATQYYYRHKKKFKSLPKTVKNELKLMKNNKKDSVYVHFSGCTVINRVRLLPVYQAIKYCL
jgi:hypothetical protein